MLRKWSSRWIDLTGYKTKNILLSIVRARIPNVVSANKAGTVYKCSCPFHKEKTPSMKFYFNKNRHIPGWCYKCLGCGTAGDVFTFLMKFERWEFWDAMLYVTKNFFPGHPIDASTAKWIQLEIPFPKHERDVPQDNLPF
jgi:DNA primase